MGRAVQGGIRFGGRRHLVVIIAFGSGRSGRKLSFQGCQALLPSRSIHRRRSTVERPWCRGRKGGAKTIGGRMCLKSRRAKGILPIGRPQTGLSTGCRKPAGDLAWGVRYRNAAPTDSSTSVRRWGLTTARSLSPASATVKRSTRGRGETTSARRARITTWR